MYNNANTSQFALSLKARKGIHVNICILACVVAVSIDTLAATFLTICP